MASLPYVYDLSAHALLSAAATALEPDELAAQTRIAAVMLGLDAVQFRPEVEDEALDRAADLLVLQVNYQLAQAGKSGDDATTFLQFEMRGPMSRSYRSGPDGAPIPVQRNALAGAVALVESYGLRQSFRSYRDGRRGCRTW